MTHRQFLFPAWLRLWHWSNAVFMLGLIASGLSLHFSDPKVGVIDFNLAQRAHNIFGIALAASYFFFLVANFSTGNWLQYLPRLRGYGNQALAQLGYYLWGIFRGDRPPFPIDAQNHFNPLQKLIYLGVMYGLMPLLIVTGLMYLWPELAPDRLFGLDGLLPVAMAHYVAAYGIVLFMVVHVYLGSCGPSLTSHYRSMITGWHEEEPDKDAGGRAKPFATRP